jgi:hypothetical protein
VTAFTLNSNVKELDLSDKIELETAAPEFPAAIPSAETPSEVTE